jgi:hypothetical protein
MIWASRFAHPSGALASGYPLHHLRALIASLFGRFGGSASIPLATKSSQPAILA